MEIDMKIVWLGENGLLFDNGKITVAVDPVGMPDTSVDVLVLTGTAENRYVAESVASALAAGGKTVLASEGAYSRLCAEGYAEDNTCVLLSPHSVWSQGGITFYSVKAEHTDRTAIGVILDDGDKTYYVSGSTLYNFDVIDDVLDLVEDGVDCAFLPISGKGGCMNAKDAADFAYELGAAHAVPVCHGNVDPSEFDFEDALYLAIGEELELD